MRVASRNTCRVCPNDVTLTPVLNLGSICISTFLAADAPDSERATLALGVCPSCSLVQLFDTVPFDTLFRHYWYRSGINETMVKELRAVVLAATQRAPVSANDTVIDIGANDGTLLSAYRFFYQGYKPKRVAFEPARNLFRDLQEHCEEAYCDPFPPSAGHWPHLEPAKVITAIAMAYDLEDPNAFIHAVKMSLHDDGVFVVQFQDLAGMLTSRAFDNICHEHLEYYTLHSFSELCKHNDLIVWDVEATPINGGSLRLFIGHKKPVPPWAVEGRPGLRVLHQIEREAKAGLLDPLDIELGFRKFARALDENRAQLDATFDQARDRGHAIDGYGASTKGNTLLQYFGLDHTAVRCIAERSPAKVGLVTPGTRIPITTEAVWRDDPAPLTLVPIWQFKDAILERERAYLERGGRFLFPLPSVVEVGQ
jgi:NDP-4-keto-2,6-dideoxyhexose 3-C-methyltransferase